MIIIRQTDIKHQPNTVTISLILSASFQLWPPEKNPSLKKQKISLLFLRDAFKKKIEKFGDFVLKGGRGSYQKPNFYIEYFFIIVIK